MKITDIEVYGFRAAIRGMRNPRESWANSDSTFMGRSQDVGPEDLKLMCTLIKRGGSHRKFLRMIQVWCDMTLPRFVWVDLDTYKVGTVKNSQSSTHAFGSRMLGPEDFEGGCIIDEHLAYLHVLQVRYQADKTAENFHALKCQLPESYLQTATYSFNYETALAIFRDRKKHILPEFSGPGGICSMIMNLPYMRQFIEATK